jgi:hypothetical protein
MTFSIVFYQSNLSHDDIVIFVNCVFVVTGSSILVRDILVQIGLPKNSM